MPRSLDEPSRARGKSQQFCCAWNQSTAAMVLPSRISPDMIILTAWESGTSSYSIRSSSSGCAFARLQPTRQKDGHGFVHEARAGIEEQRLAPRSCACSRSLPAARVSRRPAVFLSRRCGRLGSPTGSRAPRSGIAAPAARGARLLVSSIASTTTEPEWRTTSRTAMTPLGSSTRSEVTLKTFPRKEILLERTLAALWFVCGPWWMA